MGSRLRFFSARVCTVTRWRKSPLVTLMDSSSAAPLIPDYSIHANPGQMPPVRGSIETSRNKGVPEPLVLVADGAQPR